MTSHGVVARVRRLAGQRRVGHGGTLDPPATGVLVLALGRATRLLPFLPMEPKRYLARIAFGTETAEAAGVDEAAVRGALRGFLGPQQQVPPMVSAVKVGGERLYAKARRGESVERATRPIVVHALELVDFADGERPEATVDVSCSGGTYVRSLAADLGRRLGTVAHLAGLRRTAAGQFTERDAHTLAALEALAGTHPAEHDAGTPGGLARVVLAPAQALGSIAVRPLSEADAAALATGATLPPSGRAEPVAAVAPDGRLVAVIQDDAGRARSRVVLG